MNLIRLGGTIVNLDRVTKIRDLSTRDAQGQVTQGLIRVEFSSDDYIDVAGHSAEFRAWLADRYSDLTPTVP